jgi:fructoselysine-6-P-deglycase FrlB-like protein
MPEALAATLDASDGVRETARALSGEGVRRVVVTGNGAAYYVALALSLASLESEPAGPELVAVPAGLVAQGRFRWRGGDRLLAISSSGEFRDVIEAVEAGAPRPFGAITATAGSSLARLADARALQVVRGQRAVTHTQALAGGLALGLAVWAEMSRDAALARVVADAPAAVARAIEAASAWAPGVLDGRQPPASSICFGGGPAWAAAVETALLLKEVARVPCEGTETREGATSAMFGLARGHLALSLATRDDQGLDESERLCARAGADVLRLPGGELADGRIALMTALPAGVAVAAELALAAGHDVDEPAWTAAYYETARGETP